MPIIVNELKVGDKIHLGLRDGCEEVTVFDVSSKDRILLGDGELMLNRITIRNYHSLEDCPAAKVKVSFPVNKKSWQVPSDRDPKVEYTVAHTASGAWTCTHPYWTPGMKCKHIRRIWKQEGIEE